MATAKRTEPFSLGDRVQVEYYPDMRGRIVELRGPLGPGGMRIYTVRFPRKPRPRFIELREDQLTLIPAEE